MIDPNDNKTTELTVLPPKAETEAAAMQQMQQVVKAYGDNLPYSYDRVLNECAFFMEQSATAAIELGRRLILLKEMEGHGKFGLALSALGLERSTASRVMNAVLKLPSNVATSQHLLSTVKSKGKLFELITLDVDELKELSEGGTVANLTLDDVDRMSVRELRIALREAREIAKSKDGVLSNKNKKLDEMEGKLETMSRKLVEKEQKILIEAADIEREGQALRNEVTGILAGIETNGILNQLQKGFDALQAHTERTGIEHGAFMAGCLNQIKRALVQVQAEYNLYLEDDTPSPYWSSDEAALAAESAIAELNLDWDKIEGTTNAKTEH